MIRIILFSFNILLITLFFPSCYSVKKIRKRARVLEEYNKYYINDSLKFSYMMPGDYKEDTEYKQRIAGLNTQKANLSSKYCLAHFYTTIPPLLDHYTYYYKDYKVFVKELNKFKIDSLHIKDLATELPFIDSFNNRVIKCINLKQNLGKVCIIAKSPKENFKSLKNEYLGFVFKNIRTDDDYSKMEFTNPFKIAENLFIREDSTLNYLLPVEVLNKRRKNYQTEPINNLYNQCLFTYESFISNNLEKIETNFQKSKKKNFLSHDIQLDFIATNDSALSLLVNKCSKEKVVMFNENHFIPNNRLVVSLLLKKLYAKGFRYLGLESIWEEENELSDRGFSVTKTGFYTREPMMANLISEALKIGYHVFGYDDFTKDREINQAINIINHTLKQDPSAKVLIMGGFDHIYEKSLNKRKRMAEYFKEESGINPLTIDQVKFQYPTEHWLSIIDTSSIKQNTNLNCDIYLNNNLSYDQYSKYNNYKKYDFHIPSTIIKKLKKKNKKNQNYILSIYRLQDYNKSKKVIPVYNYLIEDISKNEISLLLKKDGYFFTVKNNFGVIVYEGIETCD